MATLFDLAQPDVGAPSSGASQVAPLAETGIAGAAAAAATLPDNLQPVLQLLTQGLNMHAARLDALARATTRPARARGHTRARMHRIQRVLKFSAACLPDVSYSCVFLM